MMIKLSKCSSQFVLYGKNHFEKGDEVEDIKKLIAYRAFGKTDSYKSIGYGDILFVLHSVAMECGLEKKLASAEFAESLVVGDFEERANSRFKGYNPKSPIQRYITAILNLFNGLQVNERDENGNWFPLIEMEEIEPSILPVIVTHEFRKKLVSGEQIDYDHDHEDRKKWLISHDYVLSVESDGKYTVYDSIDKDVFKVTCDSEKEVVSEAYNHLKDSE